MHVILCGENWAFTEERRRRDMDGEEAAFRAPLAVRGSQVLEK